MTGRERQREYEFVLDERERIERPIGEHDFEAAVGIQRRELRFVAREQHLGRHVDGPGEIVETALALERDAAAKADLQRGSSGRVAHAFDPPRDRTRAGQLFGDSRQRVRVDATLDRATLARKTHRVESLRGTLAHHAACSRTLRRLANALAGSKPRQTKKREMILRTPTTVKIASKNN
ncbi:MAG TPA: hypothetical protein VG865_07160, partial [Casimicrobiaceae bacterium]|nr:hypothetical protein [Casimicrobiaceae bacterium]